MPRRRPLAAILLLLAGALASGCARTPPRLPPAIHAELPGAWLGPLSQPGCPAPFEARLRMRVQAEGQPGVNIDGTLKVALPDTLHLSARLGVFRPIFSLIAVADSAEILLNDEGAYWITPRAQPDWSRMDPAAWARALHWVLCPPDLIRRLEDVNPGRMEDEIWWLSGALPGTPYTVELAVDTEIRTVREMRILQDGHAALIATTYNYRYVGEDWVPTVFHLEIPEEGFRLRGEIAGWKGVAPGRVLTSGIVRPPGWTAVRAVEPARIVPPESREPAAPR